jgi:sugar lactone lactonase YvrE
MKVFATAFALAALTLPALAATDVVVDAPMAFPESLTSTPNGTIYIGSINRGEVYRALPGAKRATTWISKQAGNFGIVLGVLADAPHGTLYVCDDNGDHAYLKTFSLKSAALMKTYEFPGGGFCNDIALKGPSANKDAYVTDTKNGRVLKLASGSDALTVWYVNDKSDPSLDGLVWQGDTLYTNTYNGNHVIAVSMEADGSAGPGANLTTSMDIFQPDGMRLSSDGKILMVEGRGKDGNGRLDEVTVSGNTAIIRVIKDHYMLPTAVTTVGSTAYVLEAKLNYQRDPALKGKDPGTFTAYAVPLK